MISNLRKTVFLAIALILFTYSLSASNKNESIDQSIYESIRLLSTDVSLAEAAAIEALASSKDASYNLGIAKCNFLLGYIENGRGKLDKATIHFFESVRYLENEDSKEAWDYKVRNLQNIALIFRKHFQYDEAQNYYTEALEISYKQKFVDHQLELLYRKAMVYKEIGDYKEAVELLFEASNLADNQGNFKKLININQQLGLIFYRIQDFENSKNHFFKIFEFKTKIDDFSIYGGRTCHNIANLYLSEGDTLKAEEFFLTSLEYKLQSSSSEKIFLTYMDLGELYLNLRKFQQAKNNYDKALAYYNPSSDPEKFKIYKQLSTLYGFLGDAKKFAEYNTKYTECLEKHLKTSEELAQMDQQYNIQLVTQRYFELVESQKRMAALKKYGGFAVAGILSFILILLIVSRIRKTRLKKSLEQELKEAMQGLDFDL